MDEFFSRLVKEGGVVLLFVVLPCHPVVWGDVWVGLILGCPWSGMFEARQCVLNVPWNGDVDFLFLVVPFCGDPDVSFACPVMGDCVVLFEGIH